MNRYMLIDFENKSIMSLNKVDIDLPENDKYCGCVNCSDYNDLVMTIIKELDTAIKKIKNIGK